MRIHHAPPSQNVEFSFDGRTVTARSGESVAAALFAAGIKTVRLSPRAQQPRGMFCLMGSCQECLVMMGGRRVLACRTPVHMGMVVEQLDVGDAITPATGLDLSPVERGSDA